VDTISDDELIAMYRTGDADAFDVLFDRHYRSVYNFALYMLSDRGRAEDILQETFLAVARTAKRYEPKGCFRTWLMRIVRNRCLNSLEAERVRRDALAGAAAGAVDHADADPTPEQCVQARELSDQLTRCIAELPDRQREAIVLFAFECRKPAKPALHSLPPRAVEFVKSRGDATFYEPAGCDRCHGQGYRGRTAIHEILIMDDRIRQAIADSKDVPAVRDAAIQSGMKTMLESGLEKAARGITSIQEILRVVPFGPNV